MLELSEGLYECLRVATAQPIVLTHRLAIMCSAGLLAATSHRYSAAWRCQASSVQSSSLAHADCAQGVLFSGNSKVSRSKQVPILEFTGTITLASTQ